MKARFEVMAKFVKPTLADVQEYVAKISAGIDPEAFVDFYETNGWMQGKGKPIKDWKACVRTWRRREILKAEADAPPKRTRKPLTESEAASRMRRELIAAGMSRRDLSRLTDVQARARWNAVRARDAK